MTERAKRIHTHTRSRKLIRIRILPIERHLANFSPFRVSASAGASTGDHRQCDHHPSRSICRPSSHSGCRKKPNAPLTTTCAVTKPSTAPTENPRNSGAARPLSNTNSVQSTTWGSLQPDIQILIFAKLPYLATFQAKTQCKAFKNRIDSEEFRSWRGKIWPREALLTALHSCVRDGVWHCTGFDLISATWFPLPPFLNLPLLNPELFKDHSLCGHGGLLCANVGKNEERIIVFNPLTGIQRELPHLNHRRSPVLMHLVVDPEGNFYKVIVAGASRLGEEHLSRVTEVFDSRYLVWTVRGAVPGPAFAINEHQAGVCVDGILNCVAFLEGGRGKGVIAFDVDEEKWLADWACPLPSSMTANIALLMESDGEVWLFTEIEHEGQVEHGIDVLVESEAPENLGRVWRNVVREEKVGSPSLQTYPELSCVPFGEGKVCVFNVIEHIGVVYDVRTGNRCEEMSLEAPPRSTGSGHEYMGFYSLNPLTFSFEPTFKGTVAP